MSESEFEAELRTLHPAPPSNTLELAIARELEGGPRAVAVRAPASGTIVRAEPRASFWGGLLWALGGAAVAAITILAWPAGHGHDSGPLASNHPVTPVTPPSSVQPAATEYFEPLESARQVVATEESEIFYDGADGPSQVVRYSSVERHSWTNPTTGALVEVEVPREDLLLVPVSYQ
jgi:hypothetical protein